MSLPRFQDPMLEPFKEMLPFARPAPATTAWPQVSQILFSHVQEVLLGTTDPQSAMDAAAIEIQDVLDR
jgi:multiple sugar transport system substrate-binding protein